MEALELLRELAAIVRGECPALLDEDSGGNSALSIKIDEALGGGVCAAPDGLAQDLAQDLLNIVVRVQRFLEPMRFDRKSDDNMAAELDVAMRAIIAKATKP